MEPAGTNLGRFPSKFLLMVVPGVIASGVVATVLYAVQVSRTPSSAELLTDLTPQGDGLSAEERRGLTRQMLKARRENPQEPAEVRPTSRPAATGFTEAPAVDAKPADAKPADAKPADTKPADTKPADTKTVDTKAPADRPPSPDRAPTAATPLPTARPTARVRPDATVSAVPTAPATTTGAVVPPVAAPAQSAPLPLAPSGPALQPPMMVNSPPGADPEAQPRSFAANVFSSLSTLAGTAANATGNTVNWVIDLPGKAISAGGRLLGGDSAASNQPAALPPPSATVQPPANGLPPATAPPPKRNL